MKAILRVTANFEGNTHSVVNLSRPDEIVFVDLFASERYDGEFEEPRVIHSEVLKATSATYRVPVELTESGMITYQWDEYTKKVIRLPNEPVTLESIKHRLIDILELIDIKNTK